jgi:hypothetical protein
MLFATIGLAVLAVLVLALFAYLVLPDPTINEDPNP